jgi:NAD(P)-dependent dehydrogenase (short-subunit alcohol dehydrogenase family)
MPEKHIERLFSVKNKVVIVTGGMGQLGTQFVKVLLENNAKVAIFDVNITKPNKFILKNKKNKNLQLCEVDVTKKSSIIKGLAEVVKKFGKPSVLINNAALDSPPGASLEDNGPFENYSEYSLDKVYQVNLKGVILCCQIIGELMASNKNGVIINISSIYGVVSPDQRIYEYRNKEGKQFFKPISYSVTKAGVINLTKYLATYWAKKNIRVNSLIFGGVFNKQDKEFLKAYSNRVPLGRMAREDEYNGAILFLASDASSYMTGSNVIIDGGFTAW